MRTHACDCLISSVSVSIGELEYGDICDTFMHVKKVFSGWLLRVQPRLYVFTLSFCVLRKLLFSQSSHIILLFMHTGY